MEKHVNGFNKVSVIIPTMNEADTISGILKETTKYVDEILVIDGHSKDKTVNLVNELGISLITQNGRGKGAALREAFEEIDGDLILIMDADASMRPFEILDFMEAMKDGVDMVKGSRFLPGGGSEDLNFIRSLGNKFFTSMVNLFWRKNYTDLCYGFAAFRKETAAKMIRNLKADYFEIETEIVIKASKLGLKVKEIPSFELRRGYGKSNLNVIRDGFRIFFTIIREFISGNSTVSQE